MLKSFEAKRDIIICIALTIAIIIIYWQVTKFKFVFYDDTAYVTDKYNVMAGLTWEGIKWAMTSTESGFWHPITWLSLMMDRALFNYNAGGFHWTNVIVHIINTIILFFLLKNATVAPLRSAVVALLFAIHPLHVESVAWVSQRKDLLSTLFGFLCLLTYVKYAKAPTWQSYVLLSVFFIFGLMSKPMVVTFPFVMLLMDYWPLNRISNLKVISKDQVVHKINNFSERGIRILLIEKAPLVFLSILASILVIYTEKKVGALTNMESLTMADRMANAVVSYVKYIAMMFWPTNLAFLYPHPVATPTGQLIVALVFLVSVTIVIVYYCGRKSYLFFGWFWYLGTLVPVIGLIQVGPHALADRYTYIPIIGLFIMCVWGIVDITAGLKYRKLFLWLVGVSTVISLSVCTWLQVGYWQNSITLFERALKVTKGNYIAMNNLGYVYINNGQVDKGINYIKEAIKVNPTFALLYHNVGVGLFSKGNYEESITYFSKAQQMAFRGDETMRYLGDAYAETGKNGMAIDAYQKSLEINSGNLLAITGRANVFIKMGHADEAIKDLRELLSYDPRNMGARKKLITVLHKTEDYKGIIAEGEKVLEIDPVDPEMHRIMSRTYQKTGEIDKSKLHFKSALNLNKKMVPQE